MFDESKLAQQNGNSAYITLKDWFLVDLIALLNIIPVAGSIAALVIYLVIAFSATTAVSIKTRVRMNLIWTLVILAIYLIFALIFGAAFFSVISSNSVSI